MNKLILLFLILACSILSLQAQDTSRYANDVETIKQYDKIYAPPKDPILFIGSSSFRLWHDLERTFASYEVLNRGLGGSVINEITYYINDLIIPYNPRQIVIYVGENDLPNQITTCDSILDRTKRLLNGIRQQLPRVPITYISMKPSPSRAMYLDKLKKTNSLIRAYMATQKNMQFIDICPQMLTPAGKPRPELFLSDSLHMNKAGYAIWIRKIKPALLKR